MKKTFLLVLFTLLFAQVAVAQVGWQDGFVGSAAYNQTLNEYGFKGTDLKLEYKKYLVKGLFFMPGTSLYWEGHDEPDVVGGSADDDTANYRIGLGLSTMIGYTLPVYNPTSWDFYVGPSFRHHFVAIERWGGRTYNNVGDKQFTRWTSIRWTCGVGFNYRRISLRAEYAFGLTADYPEASYFSDDYGDDLLTFRVGYNF